MRRFVFFFIFLFFWTEFMNAQNNVGIGTSEPLRTLDVRGDISQGLWTENFPSRRIGLMNNNIQVAGMEIENTSLGGNYSQKLHFLTHHFGTGYDRRLTITENGNVGIGITEPYNKLSVMGDGYFSGVLFSSGLQLTPGSHINASQIFCGNIAANVINLGANTFLNGDSISATKIRTSQFNTNSLTTNTLSVNEISSNKFNVTEIWNNAIGVPSTGNFVSGGGTILLNISAMAYQNSQGPAPLTINVMIDGLFFTELKGFASEIISQKTLTANFKVLTNIGPGLHTINLIPVGSTNMDSNSFTSASILELPF